MIFGYDENGHIHVWEDENTTKWIFREHQCKDPNNFDPDNCNVTQTQIVNSLDEANSLAVDALNAKIMDNLNPILGKYATQAVVDEVTEELPRDTPVSELKNAKIAMFEFECPEATNPDHVILIRAFDFYYTATRLNELQPEIDNQISDPDNQNNSESEPDSH